MPVNQKLRAIEKRLRKEGWYIAYQQATSHKQWKHPHKSGKVTTDGRGSDDISGDLLKSIYDQAGWPWPPR